MKSLRVALIVAALLTACGLGIWWGAPQPLPPALSDRVSGRESGRHEGRVRGVAPDTSSARIPGFPADASFLADPVAQAVAGGVVLETRLAAAAGGDFWTRERLVQTKVQPRPVRVVEEWTQVPAGGTWICRRREMFLADQLIVSVRPGISAAQLDRQLAALGLSPAIQVSEHVFSVRLAEANLDAVPDALGRLAIHPGIVASAEPDGVGFGGEIPNDALFAEQWALHNTGQAGGVANVDLDAPEFWDHVGSVSGMVIAVLDSGLNFTHPDLQNIAAPGGKDFVNGDNDPADDHGHGSNVTGIIAAQRNNGEGIAGLVGGVRVLVCKILNAGNSGTTSSLIAGMAYARQQGVPIMNLSLQNFPYSGALDAEITACESAGILLCICAGNGGTDNDSLPNYPSCYPQANIIAVGNHDRTDVRHTGSNFGLNSVDVFAPGREILTPGLGASYGLHTGTSESAPCVTAVATALKFLNPTWQAPELKSRILASAVQRPGYAGLCVSGGRLNAFAALALSSPPVITTQPASQTVAAGDSITLTVDASGTPSPAYQWQFGGVNITGATGNSYTIASAAEGDGGGYGVVVSNSAGSVRSAVAVVTVIVAPSGATITIGVE